MPLGGGPQPMDDSHPTDQATPDEAPGNAEHAMAGHAAAGPAAADQADHGADHGHAVESLGPVDWSAWAAGVAGVALGLAVVGCFVLATSVLPGA